MYFRSEELKKVAALNGGFNCIENAIKGEYDYIKGIAKENNYRRTFKPYTFDAVFSNWRIAINIEAGGKSLYLWFVPTFIDDEGKQTYRLESAYNGATGKNQRSDATSNLGHKLFIKQSHTTLPEIQAANDKAKEKAKVKALQDQAPAMKAVLEDLLKYEPMLNTHGNANRAAIVAEATAIINTLNK